MSNGIVIHLDNDSKNILVPAKTLFDQSGIGLELISCQDKRLFDDIIRERKNEIRALIFDLIGSEPRTEEINDGDAEFLMNIEDSFAKFNTPIFIYSGYLESIADRFNGYGNVYKIDKEEGFEPIVEKIKLFDESGFLDIFCSTGILEKEIYENLHSSFVAQFRSNEIEKIIESIRSVDGEDIRARTIDIFKRIALQSLMFELISPISQNKDTVNPIEHFYRRNNNTTVWTGDIWQKKDELEEKVFVLTPRCDIASGRATKLIVSEINSEKLTLKGNKDRRIKKLRDHLTDNILGKATRYIPETPYMEGGFINFTTHKTVEIEAFLEQYEYLITLSDDFTNEITGKFASYFLRTGIQTISPEEFKYYIEQLDRNDVTTS